MFPEPATRHRALGPVIERLGRDRSMIAYLVSELDQAVRSHVRALELERHLAGIGAIMESHSGYEERQLLPLLAGLELDITVRDVLGPL